MNCLQVYRCTPYCFLAEKKGETLHYPEENYSLRITVFDKSNYGVLTSSDYVLNYAEKISLILSSENQHYPDTKITLKARLDHNEWMFHVTVRIDFKPTAQCLTLSHGG